MIHPTDLAPEPDEDDASEIAERAFRSSSRAPRAGRVNGDCRGPRTCSGVEAREAATMLQRALGLPDSGAIDAHWARRRLRSVDYRTGEKPVVN